MAAVDMTQLALDGRDSRVQTYVQTAYGPDWWAARCVACGTPLTKYAFTEEDAIAEAVHALDSPHRFQHRCEKAAT
jgi:hypothetical protein